MTAWSATAQPSAEGLAQHTREEIAADVIRSLRRAARKQGETLGDVEARWKGDLLLVTAFGSRMPGHRTGRRR